jgi:hypothetical protein
MLAIHAYRDSAVVGSMAAWMVFTLSQRNPPAAAFFGCRDIIGYVDAKEFVIRHVALQPLRSSGHGSNHLD